MNQVRGTWMIFGLHNSTRGLTSPIASNMGFLAVCAALIQTFGHGPQVGARLNVTRFFRRLVASSLALRSPLCSLLPFHSKRPLTLISGTARGYVPRPGL